MAHLPPDTEEVLTVAALLGREAATDILTRVAELPEGRVLDIVDAAVGAGCWSRGGAELPVRARHRP